ncbi:hypothetical protein JHL21_16895 [Devosia sp. WQ 349]|uniref:DUF6644 family protein n=1 Tax=Devosia sp. WQ 349K1 TaxID=2800329 RepID=UPI0019036CD5|nr:DUF6644 family protein [Devosia sp. WQ 349K1]MBK1796168.1 hypothetical protein [Devosia sp. WQ 349K1]
MLQFATWLGETAISRYIQREFWVIPTIQSLHILAIASLVSSQLFINLRLLGRAGVDAPLSAIADRYLPWFWGAALVLALSGTLLIVGEPKRELLSAPFWIKMALIPLGLLATVWFGKALLHPDLSSPASTLKTRSIIYSLATTVIWISVMTAGRLIAYVY